MPEQWRDVPGYEGVYQVSDLGRVRRLPGWISGAHGRRRWLGGLVSQACTSHRPPYWRVDLWRCNKREQRYVHDLVLLAFVGPKPMGQETRHGKAGSLDNSLPNLCYGTHTQNEHDKKVHGTGKEKPIRNSSGQEFKSSRAAAKSMGVHPTSICDALYGRSKTCAGLTWEFV